MDGTASFGQWLKQRRKALDLTQEALARRVGCAVPLGLPITSEISLGCLPGEASSSTHERRGALPAVHRSVRGGS